MKQNNPFVVVGYSGPEYFCDREKETAKLAAAIENDRNVTLIDYGDCSAVFQELPSDSFR